MSCSLVRLVCRGTRGVYLFCAAVVLAGCSSGADGPSEAQSRAAVLAFLSTQHIDVAALSLAPATHDWAFLKPLSTAKFATDPVNSHWRLGGLAFGATPSNARACVRIGNYVYWMPVGEDCPGEWLGNRGDARSTGHGSFRLDWSAAPAVLGGVDLSIRQALDARRLFIAEDAQPDTLALVNNGSAIDAYRPDGTRLWHTDGIGMGEILGVEDLDGDGSLEVAVATRDDVAGAVSILALSDGELLWRRQFAELEFAPNRYRTTFARLNGAPGKVMLFGMTYSYSTWLFDFSAGVRNGIVRWQSDALWYDSPDKPPMVADVDNDGTEDVLADSMGVLFVLDAGTGTIKSSLRYSDTYTFGGFARATTFPGESAISVVMLSDSIYSKEVEVLDLSTGQPTLRWRRLWEEGLERTDFDISAYSGIVLDPVTQAPYVVVSVGDVTASGVAHHLELIDARTGATVATRADSQFKEMLATGDGRPAIVVKTPTGVEMLGIASGALVPLWASAPAGWMDSAQLIGASAQGTGTIVPSTGFMYDATGSLVAVVPSSYASVQTVPVTAVGVDHLTTQIFRSSDATAMVIDGSGVGWKISPQYVTQTWFAFAPRVYGVPIVVDFGTSGDRRIVVPFQAGLAALKFDAGSVIGQQPLIAFVPGQWSESFYVPVIARVAGQSTRSLIGYDSTGGTPVLVSVSGAGVRQWTVAMSQYNWEPNLVAGVSADGSPALFYNDSRSTVAIDTSTGAVLWASDSIGQCQRQMATLDWNDDGVADVALQAGSTAYVFDGTGGQTLYEQTMLASYGAYVAIGQRSAAPSVVVEHNSGGLSLFDAQATLLLDLQLDQRKLESVPTVIGRSATSADDQVYQISGAGRLRAFDLAGSLLRESDLALSVRSFAGAFVNADATTDLLIGTFDGYLVAVDGETLTELWRVQLGAAVATAVATDVDGDGVGEIVAVLGDGSVKILGSTAQMRL